jgi:hypothetical protein
MRFITQFTAVALAAAAFCSNLAAQTAQTAPASSQPQTLGTPPATTAPVTATGGTTPAAVGAVPAAGQSATAAGGASKTTTADTVAQQVKDVKAIKDALSADSDLDFSLVVGIASLIVVSGSTDYSDQSNVIHSNNLGRATPQFLTGVSFRSHLPNILPRYHGCTWNVTPTLPADKTTPGTDGSTAEKALPQGKDSYSTQGNSGVGSACSYAEPWQKRPWSAFVSVKFSPGSSQTVNGFVFGASYALTKYLNALIGFSLTPINEPAPGFRTTAAQFVTAQQKLGQDLNFNPTAMLNNSQNAFDGFPVTDSTGKLIYSGNPLTVHYHGGAIFGVSIPIYFSSAFK